MKQISLSNQSNDDDQNVPCCEQKLIKQAKFFKDLRPVIRYYEALTKNEKSWDE